MKTRKLWTIVVTTVVLGITWSCQNEENILPENDDSEYLKEIDMQGMTELGNRLKIPTR